MASWGLREKALAPEPARWALGTEYTHAAARQPGAGRFVVDSGGGLAWAGVWLASGAPAGGKTSQRLPGEAEEPLTDGGLVGPQLKAAGGLAGRV